MKWYRRKKAKETVVGVLSGGEEESPLEDELRAFNTSSMKEGPRSKFIWRVGGGGGGWNG